MRIIKNPAKKGTIPKWIAKKAVQTIINKRKGMPMKETVEIVINGPTGIGKSTIGRIIYDALKECGVRVETETFETIDPPRVDCSHLNKETLVCLIKERFNE